MQSNQELSMSMFANKADYEEAIKNKQKADALDIKANPELVLQLKEGDQVSVDGTLLAVVTIEVSYAGNKNTSLVYLRTKDSLRDEYDEACKDDQFKGEYSDYIKHLRENCPNMVYGRACMTREEMKALLESGNYYIG